MRHWNCKCRSMNFGKCMCCACFSPAAFVSDDQICCMQCISLILLVRARQITHYSTGWIECTRHTDSRPQLSDLLRPEVFLLSFHNTQMLCTAQYVGRCLKSQGSCALSCVGRRGLVQGLEVLLLLHVVRLCNVYIFGCVLHNHLDKGKP